MPRSRERLEPLTSTMSSGAPAAYLPAMLDWPPNSGAMRRKRSGCGVSLGPITQVPSLPPSHPGLWLP